MERGTCLSISFPKLLRDVYISQRRPLMLQETFLLRAEILPAKTLTVSIMP